MDSGERLDVAVKIASLEIEAASPRIDREERARLLAEADQLRAALEEDDGHEKT